MTVEGLRSTLYRWLRTQLDIHLIHHSDCSRQCSRASARMVQRPGHGIDEYGHAGPTRPLRWFVATARTCSARPRRRPLLLHGHGCRDLLRGGTPAASQSHRLRSPELAFGPGIRPDGTASLPKWRRERPMSDRESEQQHAGPSAGPIPGLHPLNFPIQIGPRGMAAGAHVRGGPGDTGAASGGLREAEGGRRGAPPTLRERRGRGTALCDISRVLTLYRRGFWTDGPLRVGAVRRA